MKPSLGFNVGGVRFFWGGKSTKIDHLAADSDSCLPQTLRAAPSDAKDAAFVMAARVADVLHVFGVSENAEIYQPVVGTNSVDVVNLMCRPCAVNVQPSKSVSLVAVSSHADLQVPVTSGAQDCSCFMASTISRGGAARENSSIGVVADQFSQSLCGKIISSHDAAPSLIGQRPAEIHSLVSASSF
jgi:hypothetical protein